MEGGKKKWYVWIRLGKGEARVCELD